MQSVEYRTAGALALGLGGLVVAASMLLSQQHQADAVPAFAAQTGQPCTACHIGGFGPQLTPFGRAFKINGYTQSGGQGWEAHMPLSGMLQGSFSHYGKSYPDTDPSSAPHTYGTNNNFAFDQASIFVAGRVSDHTGGFMQLTYSNVGSRVDGGNGLGVDNTDLRPYTTTVQAFGNDLTLGISINNNPTVQDPYNTTAAWGFPYYGTDLAPAPGASTVLGGVFGGTSIGVTGYAWYNEHLYLEVGGYEAMSPWLAYRFGVAGGPVSKGLMPYVRAAYEWDWGNNSAWAGGTFMHSDIDPQTGNGNDSYNDYSVDGGYEVHWLRQKHLYPARDLRPRDPEPEGKRDRDRLWLRLRPQYVQRERVLLVRQHLWPDPGLGRDLGVEQSGYEYAGRRLHPQRKPQLQRVHDRSRLGAVRQGEIPVAALGQPEDRCPVHPLHRVQRHLEQRQRQQHLPARVLDLVLTRADGHTAMAGAHAPAILFSGRLTAP